MAKSEARDLGWLEDSHRRVESMRFWKDLGGDLEKRKGADRFGNVLFYSVLQPSGGTA